MLRTLTTLLAVLVATTVCADDAQRPQPLDEVVLKTPAGGHVVQRGTVVAFNGEELSLRLGEDGPVKTYPADEVVSVTTPRTPSETRALAAFEAGEFERAHGLAETALAAERREWVRREILALQVRCSLALGEERRARVQFRALVQSDPATRHFELIPLVWAPRASDSLDTADGRPLLSDDLEAVRLIGASLLLQDPKHGDEAERVLRRLSSASSERVRSLAVAQRWRTRVATRPLDREVRNWERQLREMPPELRGGPHYLLGRAYRQRNEHDRAAVAFLRVPLVYGHDHRFAARAMVEAADALREIGQDNEAFGLYREVTVRYGETPFAEDARAAIAALTTPPDGTPATETETNE